MRLYKILFTVFVLSFSLGIKAQIHYDNINFEAMDLFDAKEMANAENKVILVKFDNGKKNDISEFNINEIFGDEKIIDLVRKSAITVLYIYKGDKKQEKFIKKNNISVFPTYVFFDKDMKIRYKLAGEFSKNDFLSAVAFATNDEDNMLKWAERIKSGDADSDIYFKYAKGLYLGGDDYRLAADDYFRHSNADFSKERHGVEAVLLFAEDMYDPRFILLAQNIRNIDIQGLDHKFINGRMLEIISSTLIQSLSGPEKINPSDTIGGTIEFFQVENALLLEAKVLMSYYKFIKPDTTAYFFAMNNYIIGGMYELDKREIYRCLREIADDCNDKEIIRSATDILMDLIGQYNLPEYQVLLIDLSLKSGNIVEAQHAYDVLKNMNIKNRVYTNDEMEAMLRKVELWSEKIKEADKSGRKK